jgi:hypothetical protein
MVKQKDVSGSNTSGRSWAGWRGGGRDIGELVPTQRGDSSQSLERVAEQLPGQHAEGLGRAQGGKFHCPPVVVMCHAFIHSFIHSFILFIDSTYMGLDKVFLNTDIHVRFT